VDYERKQTALVPSAANRWSNSARNDDATERVADLMQSQYDRLETHRQGKFYMRWCTSFFYPSYCRIWFEVVVFKARTCL